MNRARRGARASRRGNDEGGYILILIAICLTVLLASVGFSVDLGSWYHEAQQLQNAADAAALAGVVYMPGNFSGAQAAATTTLAKNNVVNGVGGITTSVTSIAGNSHRLKVCVTDSQVEVYFTKIVKANPTIQKCATAEYVLPVAMGSPLNELDDTSLGVYPAINGYCSASEDGDEIQSAYRGMFPNHTWATYTGCPPGQLGVPPLVNNPAYDSHGYDYVVSVVAAISTTIEVFDASWNSSAGFDGNQGNGTNNMSTTYKVTWDHNTPGDTSDDTVVSNVTVANNDASYANQWKSLATVSSLGYYYVNVTSSTNAASHGSNAFGLRARTGGVFAQCSTIPTAANYSASCPQVFAVNHLGVNAQVAGRVASFFLASVDPAYAGHQMIIGLFDPGEGGSTIEVLDPNGNPVSFSYQTVDTMPTTSGAAAFSGSGTALDVSGTVSPPTYTRNLWKFNDRKVQLTVNLPANYTTLYGTKTWWKLRYTFGASVSDRTTWDVAITGDPVRLV